MIVDKLRQNLDKTLVIKKIRQSVAYITYLTFLKRVSSRRIDFLRKSASLKKLLALFSLFIDYLNSLKTLHIITNALIIYVSTILFYQYI